MKNLKLSNIIYIFWCSIILWYLYESIVFSKEIITGVSQAVYRIINVVFPSLFGFMAVCEILIRTGLFRLIATIFTPVSKYIFGLPKELFSIYLLSCIGGYPVGVKMLSTLVKSKIISKKTASEFAPFCYCVSPSFAVGVVGIAVFSDVKIGLVVYLSCLIVNSIALFIYSHIKSFEDFCGEYKIKLDTQILVDSVVSSGKSILVISGMILFFSYFVILLDCLKFYDIIKLKNSSVILKSLLEVTFISNLTFNLKILPLITGIISTGGLCILLQLVCINDNNISLKRLFILRIPLSVASSLVCYLIMKNFFVYDDCLLYAFSQKKGSNFNFFSLICLFFMIIIIFFQKKNCNFEKSVL